ncbi:MAG: FliH/SctL family protein [Clostridiaceae bacterium]|nr:FliH/SctL family protein [Clostridiaceae bacterium]
MSKLVKSSFISVGQPFMMPCVKVVPLKKDEQTEQPQVTQIDESAVLEEINRQCESMIEKAQRQSEDIRRMAEEEGYRKGYEAGRIKASDDLGQSIEAVKQLLFELDRQKESLFEGNKDEIIRLSLKMAEKIIEKELDTDNGAFVSLFAKATRGLREQKWIKLTVSDYEAEFATMNSEYLLRMVKNTGQIEVCVQKGAPRGTCLVETESMLVDAGVATQMKQLEKTLFGTELVANEA